MRKMNEASKMNGEETIRVGSTGTIGSLMTRELESMKSTQSTQVNSEKKPQSTTVSVPCRAHPKKVQPRKNPAEDSSPKNGIKLPMLCSENISAIRTAGQGKTVKKGSSLVEVVDLKCNNPMGNRLKKLGFSKLSESIV